MPTTTDNATHVYLKKDNPKGLMQSYTGPHKIVGRPSHSTIQVKVGTFKSGVENIQLHHWQNAKPASLREDFKEAEMPTRGRKPKQKLPALSDPDHVSEDTTVPADVQMSTESEADSETAKPLKTNQPVDINKPTAPRRSERIRLKNHETSSVEYWRQPWSANEREIQTINAAISGNYAVPGYNRSGA